MRLVEKAAAAAREAMKVAAVRAAVMAAARVAVARVAVPMVAAKGAANQAAAAASTSTHPPLLQSCRGRSRSAPSRPHHSRRRHSTIRRDRTRSYSHRCTMACSCRTSRGACCSRGLQSSRRTRCLKRAEVSCSLRTWATAQREAEVARMLLPCSTTHCWAARPQPRQRTATACDTSREKVREPAARPILSSSRHVVT